MGNRAGAKRIKTLHRKRCIERCFSCRCKIAQRIAPYQSRRWSLGYHDCKSCKIDAARSIAAAGLSISWDQSDARTHRTPKAAAKILTASFVDRTKCFGSAQASSRRFFGGVGETARKPMITRRRRNSDIARAAPATTDLLRRFCPLAGTLVPLCPVRAE